VSVISVATWQEDDDSDHEEISSDQVADIIDICRKRVAILECPVALKLRYGLVTSFNRAFQRWTVGGIISSRYAEVNKVVLGRPSRPGIMFRSALEIRFPVLPHRMKTVRIHIRSIHHNVIAVAIPATRELDILICNIRLDYRCATWWSCMNFNPYSR
jgi:hypothetical protein